MEFQDKVVILTGASSGIGAGTAKHLSKLGATLVLSGRNVENLNSVASECEGATKPLIVPGDVTDEKYVQQLVDITIKTFGKINVLINNAGILATGTIENTSLAQFDHIMNTNVRSIYHLTMLAVPHLIKTQGTIVNISSVNGIRSFPGVLAYNISKSAVDQFTRCVALELAPKNVRVNSVNPGVIITEIHKRGGMDEETYAKFLEHAKSTHALGRPGKVDEVAAAIAFLAGSSSSFITGASLPVDGGRHAMCPR